MKLMRQIEGYRYTDGGVCAADGFMSNGINCGLNPNKNKNDICLIYSERECNVAAVYTTNKVKGAPITVSKKNMAKSGNRAHAVIANSKNANTCNRDGEEKAFRMCELAAEELGIKPEEIVVASTGVIGQELPIEPIESHMKELCNGLSEDGNLRAAEAIMTTDTFSKEVAVSFDIDGVYCKIGGMAKGSGMINPNMATTLSFITTDAAIAPEIMQAALEDVVKVTHNCLCIDGDMSTNDMVCIMANGAANNKFIDEKNVAFEVFRNALYIVMANMTRMLARDGEGATKMIECICSGAPTYEAAAAISKSVISSSLLKCAMFGEDANWGRILCAIGYADADFDINLVDVEIMSEYGSVEVCRGGMGVEFSEEKAKKVLESEEIVIDVRLHQGMENAAAWGCDLTYDYVKINGDYRS